MMSYKNLHSLVKKAKKVPPTEINYSALKKRTREETERDIIRCVGGR